ncbi:hypothetical protein PoB_000202300 [Plakobranchus ocellatus]|uniref:Uncharacterized protein n=1 Tax=Plakobranchus ocellatus TaxID=259542 RepID=A0AAV3XZW0_9GAST|nr:hypothetical protein PoB_000202300 [Plakobranchus ocellatus]
MNMIKWKRKSSGSTLAAKHLTPRKKNMWLPNIVQDSSELQDDVISNYDNTKYKVPRVEVHPSATPSPYAILNLENLNGHRHRDNHEV